MLALYIIMFVLALIAGLLFGYLLSETLDSNKEE